MPLIYLIIWKHSFIYLMNAFNIFNLFMIWKHSLIIYLMNELFNELFN
jgi:hypothetical protein